MRKTLGGLLLLCVSALACPAQQAPVFPTPGYFKELFRRPAVPVQVGGPDALDDYIHDGKLVLSLEDAIRLTLLNNTDVRINQLRRDQFEYGVLRARGPFDPVLTAGFAPSRSTSPTTSTLQGAQTLSSLDQPFTSSYNQTFLTGTNLNIRFNTDRSTTNSSFATFNPSFFSGTTFSLSQPLLRGRGFVATRGPILIAQRNLKQSHAVFESQLNDSILNVINQYWALVQAQKSLVVVQNSLKLAEESYNRDKRALELGALSPLEIYRSEGTVAQRRLQVIQAEYAIKPLEDQLRRTIGADLEQRAGALDIILSEKAEPAGELVTPDMASAVATAMEKRPEVESARLQLVNDDTSIQIATNNLKPDVSLSTFYTSNGRGGNQVDVSSGTPVIIAPGGLADSLDQVGSFNFPSYGMSLQLRLPIRNRTAEADLGTALLNKRTGLYQFRQVQQVIREDVRDALHRLEESKLTIAASATALDLARKTLAAEQRKYELGAQTIFFVLDAQNTVEQSEQSYVQAQINYQLAIAAFDRSTGNLLDRNRVLIQGAVH